jgi:hypothetical protein
MAVRATNLVNKNQMSLIGDGHMVDDEGLVVALYNAICTFRLFVTASIEDSRFSTAVFFTVIF